MNVDFACTCCGDCCRSLRLPLSTAEAVRWLQDGHPVQVLCEAIPWPAEPPATDLPAAFKRERSFAAMSGTLPIRVLVTLVAPLGAGCPHLQPDNRCDAYERRPLACRVYPAETNPFMPLITERRLCPPEAWRDGSHPLMRDGAYVDPELRLLIKTRLERGVEDVVRQEALCGRLGLRAAAMANEGYVVHSPGREELLGALTGGDAADLARGLDWVFVSERAETVEAIRFCEAGALLVGDGAESFEFLSLFKKGGREAAGG